MFDKKNDYALNIADKNAIVYSSKLSSAEAMIAGLSGALNQLS